MATLLWQGASAQNGGPIRLSACCVTRASKNDKTGDCIQYMVSSEAAPPVDAEAGRDACGGCAFLESKVCYVNKSRLRRAWDSNMRAEVEPMATFAARKRVKRVSHRLGMEGDPGSVPKRVWVTFFDTVVPKRWTSFIHNWRERTDEQGTRYPAADPWFAQFSMASVDSVEERTAAKALGFRTARVATAPVELQKGEIVCPAIARDDVTCASCGLCNGRAFGKRTTVKDIVFPAHGNGASKVDAAVAAAEVRNA